MNPVVVFRHAVTEGPGYFATFLERNGIPWTLLRLDEGEPVPCDLRSFSGAALMGGPMSVNDDLPWIAPVLEFIRKAVAANLPLAGHCLGGQLMAKALGGVVSRNPVKEIGWAPVRVTAGDAARRWLGEIQCFESFHWHGETFTIPPDATCLASSEHCANQMFDLGPHIGMQCHVEMTRELIALWCRDWQTEVTDPAQRTPSVQTPAEMLEGVEEKVHALNTVADHIYAEWIKGLRA